VTGEQARGAILYGCAAVLLTGGAVWWAVSAPAGTDNSQVEQWRTEARKLLPDSENLYASDSVALEPNIDQQVVEDLGQGEFMVTVVCAGAPDSQLRVSLGDLGADSGHGLRCTGDRSPDVFSVSVVDDLRMNVSVGDAGPVVFRYTVLRQGG
jgi:hypothetical protein